MNIHFNNFKDKKKIGLLLLAFALLTPLVILSFSSSSFDSRSSARTEKIDPKFAKANLNPDNEINLDDFSVLYGHIKKNRKDPKYYNKVADLASDNKLDLDDFLEWLKLYRAFRKWVTEPIDVVNPTVAVGYTGTGKDGSVTVNANMGHLDINKNRLIQSRDVSCADAPKYSVTSFTDNGKSLTTAEAIQTACLAKGDEILIINLQGTAASVSNVGNWETLIVESVSGQKITFTTKKRKFYGINLNDDSGIGLTVGHQRVMVQRVPNYDNVTVSGGALLSASGFDGRTGGVLFFRAKGTVNIAGSLAMSGRGYFGGKGDADITTHTPPGESLFVDKSTKSGYGGGSSPQKVGGKGGATEIPEAQGKANLNGNAGTYSGGGGAATWGNTHNLFMGTPGVGNSTNLVSGGGGGGGSATGGYFLEYEWWRCGHGGGGGGGGHATGGSTGVRGSNKNGEHDTCNLGTNGSVATSGNGGSAKLSLIHVGNDDEGHPFHTRFGYGGSGGGGSADYASAKLDKLLFGSGGGAGGTGTWGGAGVDQVFLKGGNGGNGGGIIFISANNLTVSGTITVSGGNGEGGKEHSGARSHYNSATSGGGGGGAGGSVRLESPILTIGEKKVVSKGGGGGIGSSSCGGGTGGVGVIAVYTKKLSGTSEPGAASVAY